MSIADETTLRVLAQLLRAGLLPREDAPAYPDAAIKAALAKVGRSLAHRPLRRPS